MTFNEFCIKNCSGLYDPKISDNDQCNGYHQLKKMIDNDITPASLAELHHWETTPSREELHAVPDIKYLQFLHPLFHVFVIRNWSYIKTLK